MARLEKDFQKPLIQEIKKRFPNAVVKKNDPKHIQGIPDLSVDIGAYSYHLEVKRSKDAPHRPNQPHYIKKYNDNGGWARTIYPENKDEVLDEMEQISRARGTSRVSKR